MAAVTDRYSVPKALYYGTRCDLLLYWEQCTTYPKSAHEHLLIKPCTKNKPAGTLITSAMEKPNDNRLTQSENL